MVMSLTPKPGQKKWPFLGVSDIITDAGRTLHPELLGPAKERTDVKTHLLVQNVFISKIKTTQDITVDFLKT